ncbi:MAG: hypothetical protein KJ063_12445 [Anaerolineae bacterium]|nr:hypothetical protein [Anaerolineae bacterium]
MIPEYVKTNQVQEALRLWHGGDVANWPLAHLRLGLRLRPLHDTHRTLAESGPAAQNRAILDYTLTALRELSAEAEELLRSRYQHRIEVMALANSLNLSEDSIYYRQRQAISWLTDIINQQEQEASSSWQERILNRLELPTYTQMIGVEIIQNQLQTTLTSGNEQFIISLEGLGGLGKTALADFTVRQLIYQRAFDEIAWVTAKQTHLSMLGRLQVESGKPALTFPMLIERLASQFELDDFNPTTQLQRQRLVQQFLRERRCLVVIDNLETVTDYRILLPELRKWQNPSKFVLTSRHRLLDEPGVFSLAMPELSRAAAFQLIRLEGKRTGTTALENAPDQQLDPIYQVVGGNPMALKLVVGQLRFHSLSRVLNRFSENRDPTQSNDLFDYIYQEIWEQLPDDSKITLLALSQAGEMGFTFEHLVEVANLPEERLESNLEQLILLSLVEPGGTLLEKRYRLHRLTDSFVHRLMVG